MLVASILLLVSPQAPVIPWLARHPGGFSMTFSHDWFRRFTATALLGATPLLVSAPLAAANFEACGDIDVEAEATCVVEVEGGCMAKCEPLNFTAACSAELYASCDGECSLDVEAECTTDCSGRCQADCEVDPGNFDCEASCTGSCEADCSGTCSAKATADCEAEESTAECEAKVEAECGASCSATCKGECSASCSGDLPEADCDAQCEACCTGECNAEANLSCQVDCQAEGFVQCESRLQGGCEVACQEPEGALFCDGQFVDHDGNLEACVDALNDFLEEHVQAEGEASGSCQDNECSGMASGSVQCAALHGRPNRLPLSGTAALIVLGASLVWRRRRRG